MRESPEKQDLPSLPISPAAVSPNVAFLLKKSHLATQKRLEETLSNFNITRAQWDVMRQLWDQDGLSQRALQENLGIEPATLTGIVDGLVKRGLLTRQLSQEDGRVKELFLTPEGQELGQRRIAEVINLINGRLTKDFSSEEIDTLKNFLFRLIANME